MIAILRCLSCPGPATPDDIDCDFLACPDACATTFVLTTGRPATGWFVACPGCGTQLTWSPQAVDVLTRCPVCGEERVVKAVATNRSES